MVLRVKVFAAKSDVLSAILKIHMERINFLNWSLVSFTHTFCIAHRHTPTRS